MSTLAADGMAEFAAGIDRMSDAELPTVVFRGEVHPYADRWPMRPADEIEEMSDSIRVNGQRFPILLTADGVLVDGRNRLRACELAGVEPWFEVRDELQTEDAITSFIWDANGDRRNLSKGQRAMLAALRPGTARSLSEQTSVALGYIAKAATVIQWCDTEVVDAVVAGDLPLNDAYATAQQIKATEQAEEIERKKRAKAEREQAEREAAQLEDLRMHRADLAALVDEGRLPLAEALRLRADEAAKAKRQQEAKERADRQFVADVHAAFAAIAMLRHPEHRKRLDDNWHPGAGPTTADDLRTYAATLHDLANNWKHA